MFFKKMTMVIMMAGFVSGIVLQSASVDAKSNDTVNTNIQATTVPDSADETTNGNTVQTEEADKDSAGQKNPVETEKSAGTAVTGSRSNANIPAPAAATPQVITITKNIAATSGKNAVKAKKTAKAKKKYSSSELRLMASIINCEAGGESFQGQVAVGIVVMNRVKSDMFPNSIKKVIYQKGQFSPVTNGLLQEKLRQYDAGKIHSAQWKSCIKAAKQALNGKTVIKLKGKTKSMKGVRFFSVYLKGAKFRLGGHRFR